MDNFLIDSAGYPITVLYTAILAAVATSLVKPTIKNKLSGANLSEKDYTDRLRDACFYINLALCLVGYGLTAIITLAKFDLADMSLFTLSALSATELIYSLYEKVGLKEAVKKLMKLLSDR